MEKNELYVLSRWVGLSYAMLSCILMGYEVIMRFSKSYLSLWLAARKNSRVVDWVDESQQCFEAIIISFSYQRISWFSFWFSNKTFDDCSKGWATLEQLCSTLFIVIQLFHFVWLTVLLLFIHVFWVQTSSPFKSLTRHHMKHSQA